MAERSGWASWEGLTMPQHDWQQWIGGGRYCGDCNEQQRFDRRRQEWLPEVNPICPGDGRDSSRRRRPAPNAPPAERTRKLEMA
jgi:hypothetical protein